MCIFLLLDWILVYFQAEKHIFFIENKFFFKIENIFEDFQCLSAYEKSEDSVSIKALKLYTVSSSFVFGFFLI